MFATWLTFSIEDREIGRPIGKYREIAWTCEFKGEKSKRDQFPVSASIM